MIIKSSWLWKEPARLCNLVFKWLVTTWKEACSDHAVVFCRSEMENNTSCSVLQAECLAATLSEPNQDNQLNGDMHAPPFYVDWLTTLPLHLSLSIQNSSSSSTVSSHIVSSFACLRTPLCSGGQSSWLQIQKSRFYSLRYQIFWGVVGLQRGLEYNPGAAWKKTLAVSV
jgi:hypothetical protein